MSFLSSAFLNYSSIRIGSDGVITIPVDSQIISISMRYNDFQIFYHHYNLLDPTQVATKKIYWYVTPSVPMNQFISLKIGTELKYMGMVTNQVSDSYVEYYHVFYQVEQTLSERRDERLNQILP